MSSLSNKASMRSLALEYVNSIATTQAQTEANLEILQTIAEAFISSVGIELATQYLDLEKASGKWLDDIAKTVGVSRSELQGTEQAEDDDFFKIYIKFAIIRNFSKASFSSISRMLFVLFGNDVYIARQPTAFTIGIFADETVYETIKILINRDLIPLALCHDIVLLGQTPPAGFEWWGFFALPYSLVIDGKMTEERYNELLATQESTHWAQNNDVKYLYIPEELIYRP